MTTPLYVLEVYPSADIQEIKDRVDRFDNDAVGLVEVDNAIAGPTTVVMRIPDWKVCPEDSGAFICTLLAEREFIYELISRSQALMVRAAREMEGEE